MLLQPAARYALIVDDHPAVREAVQRRRLVLELLPGCAAAQGVEAIATRLSP